MSNKNALTIEARYQRAQTLLQGYGCNKLIQNDSIFPYWIEGTDCFWYERTSNEGKEYRLVNSKSANNRAAFDHQALAQALGQSAEQVVDENNLPITDLNFTLSPLTIRFTAFDLRWTFEAEAQTCKTIEQDVIKGLRAKGCSHQMERQSLSPVIIICGLRTFLQAKKPP